ncbi:MAG: hypothetical protein EOP40_10150 [Rubrivivax sp.]|nr:MAG: hypothetical protein EOP40_10150 [Rubrivivax sp.]
MVGWSLLSAGLFGLGGCATTTGSSSHAERAEQCYRHGPMRTCVPAQRASEAKRAVVHALASPPANLARLVVVRNNMSDFHRHAHLLLDGRPTQELIPCSSVGVDVVPGPHRLLVVPAAASPPLMLKLAPGTLTVIQVSRVVGQGASQGFELKPLSRAQALPLVQECQVLGLIDHTRPAGADAATAER